MGTTAFRIQFRHLEKLSDAGPPVALLMLRRLLLYNQSMDRLLWHLPL